MNLIDFWKEYVNEHTSHTQYKREELDQLLDQKVPTWREDVKDETLWPEFHFYGANINETIVLDKLIEEGGVKLAIYVYHNPQQRHLESVCALNYLAKRISTYWNDFTYPIQVAILEFHLSEFMQACTPEFWGKLDERIKDYLVFTNLLKEKDNLHDLTTKCLFEQGVRNRHMYFENHSSLLDLERERTQILPHNFQDWNKPDITPGNRYIPSRRLEQVTNLIERMGDERLLEILKSFAPQFITLENHVFWGQNRPDEFH